MASFSLQTNAGASDNLDLDHSVTAGTAAPSSETFEFRWNQAATGTGNYVPTRQDAIRALEQFIRYIEDGRYTIGAAL